MRKVLQKILIVIAVIAAGAALFFLWQYYPSLKDFRQATNYRFASPADLYYQLHTENWPHYTFLDRMCLRLRWTGIRYERWKSKQSGEIGIFRLSL